MKKRYRSSKRHTIQVDYVTYMDEIAEPIGVSPNFWKLFFHVSPSFALRALFGPVVPPYFRIFGHGKWDGARKAIDDVWYRNFFSTKTRVVATQAKKTLFSLRLILTILVLVFIFRHLRR